MTSEKRRPTMRTFEEIKADLEKCQKCHELSHTRTPRPCPLKDCLTCGNIPSYRRYEFELELFQTITAGIPLNRLEEICAAEKDGRCVVLPCKVGDTVWVISGCDAERDPEIEEKTVYSFDVGEVGRVLLRSDAFDGTICYADELGKIVGSPFWQGCFLTRAEAEKTLGKEQRHED